MIRELYERFEKSCAAYEAIQVPPVRDAAYKRMQKQFDGAVAKASKIAARIVKLPAKCIDDMLIKIKVACWCGKDLPTAELDNWTPGRFCDNEQFYALVSLRLDLQRLKAAA
jgi:hypothetical protein